VREGLSDLPWHRDCGMGGHGRICPRIVATICLTTGTAEAGELRVIPGSHRGSFHFIDGNHPDAPTGVPVATEAGDVSIHYSDVAHVSMAPTSTTGPHRISVLVDFGPDDLSRHRGEGRYNDALFDQAEGGKVAHLRDQIS
jgi:ectoine hydroxylase-related dioxygenase (phytanoyl-CoA dioxygenase family)